MIHVAQDADNPQVAAILNVEAVNLGGLILDALIERARSCGQHSML